MLDYQLATSLNVSLLHRGHANCEVTADAGKVTVVVNQGRLAGQAGPDGQGAALRKLEEQILEVCGAVEGVVKVEVRPGVATPRRALAHAAGG